MLSQNKCTFGAVYGVLKNEQEGTRSQLRNLEWMYFLNVPLWQIFPRINLKIKANKISKMYYSSIAKSSKHKEMSYQKFRPQLGQL